MVICVQGGLIQGIYSDRADVPVTVVDWDVSPGDIEDEFIRVVSATHHGRPIHAYVAEPPSIALGLLAGTDLEAILQAAEPIDDS